MMVSAKESNARMRKLWGGSSWERQAKSRANGMNGGAPKKAEPKPIKLTAKARTVNNMLLKGLTPQDIADILDMSHRAVHEMAKRYNLPRGEPSKTKS
jgi:DNA-binding NarL/FixJ family response regulator